jgi:hypothetical protein
LASEAGCKTPFSFSKTDVAAKFLGFADAPDELVPEIDYDQMPCPKGKKASKKCRERHGDSDDSSSKSGGDSQPTQKSTSPEATTTDTQPTQTVVQSSATPTDAPSSQISVQSSSSGTRPIDISIQSSSASSDAGPSATADCEAIGKKDLAILLEEDPSLEKDLARNRTAGTTFQSRRLEARAFSPKPGTVCRRSGKSVKRGFKSLQYPSSGEAFMVSLIYMTD